MLPKQRGTVTGSRMRVGRMRTGGIRYYSEICGYSMHPHDSNKNVNWMDVGYLRTKEIKSYIRFKPELKQISGEE